MSNELEVSLPLETEFIRLPTSRPRDADMYKEYIEIREGSGYLPEMDGHYKIRKNGPRTALVEVQDGELIVNATVTHVTATVPTVGRPGDNEHLPVPRVRAENRGNDSALISWDLPRSPDPQYRLLVYVVNVIGRSFDTSVNSDISFECLQEEGGEQTAAVQHCWNITKGRECFVKGLKPGLKYKIFVVANYSLVRGQQPCEIQAASDPIIYTTLGPPAPPKLKVINADLYRGTVEWEKGESHHEVVVTGFRVLVDGKQLGEVQSRTTNQTIIDNLQPGRTIRVQVVACTSHVVGDSEPSKPVQVTCPPRPQAPMLAQQPSYRAGAVIVGWERPVVQQSTSVPEDIVLYKIFLDGKPYGEVKASVASNKNGYQYCLASLNAGQVYDVSVQSVAGQRQVEPGANHILCLCESEMSSSLPVQCAAPPTSPMLRVEGLHDKGIDITWDMPQQYGDAAVSGFQLLKDGRLYGSIMPPDVHNLRIKDVDLGNKVMLQILALTDHPVGRQDPEPSKDGKADIRPGESGFAEVFVGDRYSACKPGPKLVVNFTGLVQAPSRVWCEQVTGHSALVVWSTGDRLKPHFVPPESYQVTWWQVTRDDIQSQSTTGDHLLITGLKPNTSYDVVVEARRMQNYEQVPEESRFGEDVINTFIITSKSERLSFQTGKPPAPPTNLGVLATTCHSVQLAWDPPEVYGVDVIGIRLDAVPLKSIHGKHILEEVMPDRTTGILNGLSENTEYLVTVTAITEEYFEQLSEGDPIKRSRSLSRNRVPDEHAWLPSSTIIVMTSGTEPPCEVKVREATVNSVLIAWKPAVVHGSNRLQSTIVRWAEAKHKTASEEASLAHHHTLVADSNEMNIENLTPGVLYRVVVEAVVSVKTALDGKRQELEEEKRNRRTTHVMSQPLYVRTRAPCEPPKPIITAYTASTINLYWEKPLLYQVIGKEADGTPKYLKLSLEGYRLEINGKPHMRLVSTAQSCTLVKCRPGKTYSVVLVALTCTDDVKRERRRKYRGNNSVTSLGSHSWNTTSEDEENDESPSATVEVTIPTHTTGALSECCALYESPHTNNIHAVGDIHAEWSVIGNTAHIDQFDVTWLCLENKEIQKRMVDNKTNFTKVPPLKQKSIYDVTVESQLNTDAIEPQVQKVQVLIPGPPDAPEIWTRSIEKEEFTIEWGEPKLWVVKIRGYQVYLNGRRVGNELNANHRRAIIPCKPRRSYKVNMVALSADAQCADSEKSNTLLISTGGGGPYIDGTSTNLGGDRASVPVDDIDRREIPVRVVKVTDSEIHLDWSLYPAVEGIWNYRIQWSSVAQQSEREVKFPAAEKSCIIHKCYPGTNHFIRLLAMSEDDQVLDQSGALIIQTCAPPDTPVVTLRSCNFRYVTIQWEKPSVYGDALITGHKVYVNGVVEAILGPDQHTYTYSNGKWCREYSFQVQALTGVDIWNSKPSDPLVVTWPGLQPPVLRRAPSISGNSVKVVWDKPSSTDGVKIKQYKALCTDNDTGKVVQVISPIHPDTTEAEFHNLRTGTYMLHLDVFLHGSDEIIKSDVLTFTPTLTPDPPHINVNVIGLEERRQIEKITCDLINKRDRLLNEVASSGSLSPRHTNEQAKNRATENLAQVETMLDDCLEALHHYTGHLLAHVSWTCPQSNPDIHIMGFKVLVDGQQYGTMLHNGIKNVRLKLGLNQASHRLSMVAVGDNHQATSTESNVVELLTEPFLPFSFFSYLESGPSPGAAPFEDTLSQERRHTGRKPLNQMLQKRKVPPPSCTVVDVFDGELRPLFQPSGPAAPTAMLFWSRWNHSSMKALSWFVRFARENKEQYDFVAVACGSGGLGGAEKQELVRVITDNGWRDDSSIRHITSQSAAFTTMGEQVVHQREGYISQHKARECFHDCKWKKDGGVKHQFEEITDLFGVSGVPMLIVIHPDDYIAWKGRYCAIDYTSYDSFLRHTFAKVLGQSSPGPDPFDAKISVESHDIVHRRMQSESQMLIHRPMSSTSPSQTIIHTPSYPAVNGHARPDSAHTRFFIKTNKHKNGHKRAKSATISVSSRPFSASHTYGIKSPYEQRLVNTYSPSIKSDGSARRLRSAKKLKYIS